MNTQVIDEREFVNDFKRDNKAGFHKFVKDYDAFQAPVLRTQGWEHVNTKSRTIVFTFGEIAFSRRIWKKGKKTKCPVDEKLGLEPFVRCSKEMIFQIAKISTTVSYSKTCEIIELVYNVIITKDTVLKARKLATRLLEEKKEYKYYEELTEAPKKIKADVLYVEGDGVMLKTTDKEADNHNTDMAHFIIHTGSEQVSKTRCRLKNKHEIACLSNTEARERMMNYIYNHYEITEDTILITNSDHGHGYTPYIFKELKDLLQIKHHHHFWDQYHLNKKIKDKMKFAGNELVNKVFKAVQAHDKGLLRAAIDTAESLIEDDEHQEEFTSFKRKMLHNFQYTKPAEMRGFSNAGIGIMESQHRKITYRMKKRGMYWSPEGANTMTQLIILNYQNELRDLFFGDWRERYAKYQEVEKIPHRANAKSVSKTHQVKQRVTPKKHR
ncbi:ISLre2 family transposase [Pseudolactococcus yaeyamensis]